MENMEKLKNVLVTGGAGFIGSHLVGNLIESGHKVAVVDDFSSGKKSNLDPRAKFYKTDVESARIRRIFEIEKPQVVFHLAAQPIVETAYKNPKATIETNVMGTVNILEACRQTKGLELAVVCSSDKAYGKSKVLPYTENSALKGDHPYDVSKTAADLIAQTYFKTYGLPVAVTRFSNVFGPADLNFSRLIPGVMKAVIKREEFLVRSDGKMIREYSYADDIAKGCLKLMASAGRAAGEAFNFGSKNIFSVIETIRKIETILGLKIDYRVLDIAKNEIPAQYLDWSKAKKILGWQPETGFDDGIKRSFGWYESFFGVKN